jgi:hypothetical protein
MTVQNHLMPNGSQQWLDSISFWIKGSKIYFQSRLCIGNERRKILFIHNPQKELPLNRTNRIHG